MKKLILSLLFTLPTFSQVGIGTTNPTETLHVNGSLRVESLYTGTPETDQFGKFSTAPYTFLCAGIFKDNGDPVKAVNCTVKRINGSTIRVTFNTPLSDKNYVINLAGEMRLLYYSIKTTNFFDIILYENFDNNIHNFIVFKI